MTKFFWRRVQKTEDCWLWTGAKNYNYGIMRNTCRAHRYSYALHKGTILNGLFVCHTCDNPSCVNPDHLWVGTPAENRQDMVKKGRENLVKPPIPQEKISRMIEWRKEGYSCNWIAGQLGISVDTVRIKMREKGFGGYLRSNKYKKPGRRLADRERVFLLKAQGVSSPNIAKQLGVSYHCVYKIVRGSK